MKVISIGTDRKILEENSSVRERQIEYGKFFDELHIIIFSKSEIRYSKSEINSKIKISENVWAYPTNSKNKLGYFWDAYNISKNIIDNSKFKNNDFVLSTQDPFETGIIGVLLKIRFKLPLQIQVHTDFVNKYFITHSLLNFIRFPLGIFTLSFADSVRVVSERIAKSVHSLSHNISVLPIFTAKSETRNLQSKIKEGEKIKFLTVCRLEKEKDLRTAILAFRKFLNSGLDAEFIIVGDGSERKKLEYLVWSLELGDRVKLAGWQNDLSKYYECAHVYISTSLYEGYGMSIVEAASYGLPLILTDAGISSEYFKDYGAYVCNPKDVNSISKAMFEFSDSKKRIELGEMAKRVVEKIKISKEEYLEKYKKSFTDALDYNNQNLGLFKKNLLLRYLVAGLTGASVNILLLYIATSVFGIWYLYSSLIAFLVSIIISFVLQKFWTFDDKATNKIHSQFGGYIIVGLAGVAINAVSMFILVDLFGLWYILAQIITNVFIAVFNFLMYKFFIFNKK